MPCALVWHYDVTPNKRGNEGHDKCCSDIDLHQVPKLVKKLDYENYGSITHMLMVFELSLQLLFVTCSLVFKKESSTLDARQLPQLLQSTLGLDTCISLVHS